MLLVIAPLLTGIAYAQSEPVFDVTPATAGAARVSRTPLKIAFQAAHVWDIIAFAYALPADRIERRPQWMYDNLYNVAVTSPVPAAVAEQKLALQKLLEKRFGLVVHRVTYESQVYFLTAGANAKLTPAKEADADGIPEFRTFPAGASGFPGLVCVASHVSMSDLADWLRTQVQLPVVDKTGITGLFDIEIPRLPFRGGAEGTIRAVGDALGLNLELKRGTAESMIIDGAQPPRLN